MGRERHNGYIIIVQISILKSTLWHDIKMYCFVVKLIEIKLSMFLNFFDFISKFFSMFVFSI